MNETLKKTDAADVDQVLSRFFRSEMPAPWPECQALPRAEPRRQQSWFRSAGRLALAAAIALFFLSYLALSGFFPQLRTQSPVEPGSGQTIGQKQGVHKGTPKALTPRN